MNKRRLLWLAGAVLALIPALVIYRKVLGLGWFADDFVLLEMLHQKSPLDLIGSFAAIVNKTRSRPVVAVLYLLEGRLGIADGKLPHLTNILIHLLNAGLLSYWIKLLTRNLRAGIFSGLLFLYHPIQPEAVFWVTGRFDPVCLVFFLLTLIFYLKDREHPSLKYSAAAAVFALLSFFSKETGLMVIGVAVITDLVKLSERNGGEAGIPLRSLPAGKEIIRRWAVLAGLVVVYVSLRIFFTGSLLPAEVSAQMGQADLWDRLKIALDHLLIPIWNADQSPVWMVWVLILIPALALGLNLYRPARLRHLLVALSLLIFCLIPALGSPFELKNLVSSRFLYLPAAGSSMILGLLLADARRPNLITRLRGLILFGILVLAYSIQLNRNLPPFQQAGKMVFKVIQNISSACAISSCPAEIHLMDFPRSQNGVMLFSRDIALSSALNLAINHQIKFGPEAGYFTGPILRTRRKWHPAKPLLQAYHTGRVGPGEYLFKFPAPLDLVSGKAAIFGWDEHTGRLFDLTGLMIRAIQLRGQKLKESPGPDKPLFLAKEGRLELLFLKDHLSFDQDRKIFQALGPDPYLESGNLWLDPLLVDKVVVTMSVTPTLPGQKISAQLFWNDRQNRSFTERMSVIFPVEGDGRPHRYTIPLADNPDFVLPFREIVQLRFDPMDSPGKLTLDDFQIVPFPRE